MKLLRTVTPAIDNSRISLVICAYNEENYIGACLQYAVKNSQGRFYEIIVVDNASSDRTKEIAESFSGVRVVQEPDKGPTKARQRGFLEAQGDIIAYIDADTRIPPNWFDIVLQEFERDRGLGCLSGPCIYYDIPKWQQFLVTLYWYTLAYPIYLVVQCMIVGGNFVIKKDILKKMGGFNTSIDFYGDDTDIARRAYRFGKVKFQLNFMIYTSGRRLSNQGIFKVAIVYMVNFLSEIFIHKPVTKSYKDIR